MTSRRQFLTTLAASTGALVTSNLQGQSLKSNMPVGFVGHGSPMMAFDSAKSADLRRWAEKLPKPSAILIISAHWEEAPMSLGVTSTRPLIYDFYNFPKKLYELTYKAPGDPLLAQRVEGLLASLGPVKQQPERGLDHGVWVPLKCMFPAAEIPVLQLSIPTMDVQQLFQMGRALAPLREDGVFILGSGNITHNLSRLNRSGGTVATWAQEFDAFIEQAIVKRDVDSFLDYVQKAPGVHLAHPTHEHFVPLAVTLGAASLSAWKTDFPVSGFELGSISRRCVQLS
jgi:4,5-DOPA dioxygenase extradiol